MFLEEYREKVRSQYLSRIILQKSAVYHTAIIIPPGITSTIYIKTRPNWSIFQKEAGLMSSIPIPIS